MAIQKLLTRQTEVAEVRLGQREKKKRSMKLPNLNLEQFSGNTMDWPKQFSSYNSAIHERGDLTVGEKFDCLDSYLRGQTKLAFSNMEPSKDAYADALDILKKCMEEKNL